MADVELRPITQDAERAEIIHGIDRLFGILRGNVPGHFSLIGSDGISRDIRGGAQLATGLFTLKIRSGAGNHLDIRNAADTASQINVTDALGVEVGATVFHMLTASSRIKGIFSGAVPASKTLFLTDATNDVTVVGAIPSGSGTTAGWVGYNNSAPGSATGAALLQATSTAVEVRADNPSGAGALPMDFYTNATRKLRLFAAGGLEMLGVTAPTVTATHLGLFPDTSDYWNKRTSAGATSKMVDVSQIQTLEAVGSASGPTRNFAVVGATYGDLDDMTLTFTGCTAGDKIEVEFSGAFSHNTARAAVVVALKHDANAETRTFAINSPANAGDVFMMTTHGVFTATAGTNVFTTRWLVAAGIATASGVDRYMKGRRGPV